jgi:hypothetical protein
VPSVEGFISAGLGQSQNPWKRIDAPAASCAFALRVRRRSASPAESSTFTISSFGLGCETTRPGILRGIAQSLISWREALMDSPVLIMWLVVFVINLPTLIEMWTEPDEIAEPRAVLNPLQT